VTRTSKYTGISTWLLLHASSQAPYSKWDDKMIVSPGLSSQLLPACQMLPVQRTLSERRCCWACRAASSTLPATPLPI
jgi:hypothetical protein